MGPGPTAGKSEYHTLIFQGSLFKAKSATAVTGRDGHVGSSMQRNGWTKMMYERDLNGPLGVWGQFLATIPMLLKVLLGKSCSEMGGIDVSTELIRTLYW